MSARIIEETEVIEVASPPVLLYGQPGVGKTSLAGSADNPIVLDADSGAHRSSFRKRALSSASAQGGRLPLSWTDLIEAEASGLLKPYRTQVFDTVGAMVESLKVAVIRESAKNGSLDSGPNQYGWTKIKSRFADYVSRQRQSGVQLVFVAHEKPVGESRYLQPDISGGSYSVVMGLCDLVGYCYVRGQQRVLDFSPSEDRFGKNPCGWESVAIPHLAKEPRYLQGLLDQAKAHLGQVSEASAAVAKAVGEWQTWLESDPNLEAFNGRLGEVKALADGVKNQVRHLLNGHVAQVGWKLDRGTLTYYRPETLPEPIGGAA